MMDTGSEPLYISRYIAARPTLQTLSPIQSSTSFSQYRCDPPLFFWPFTFHARYLVSKHNTRQRSKERYVASTLFAFRAYYMQLTNQRRNNKQRVNVRRNTAMASDTTTTSIIYCCTTENLMCASEQCCITPGSDHYVFA